MKQRSTQKRYFLSLVSIALCVCSPLGFPFVAVLNAVQLCVGMSQSGRIRTTFMGYLDECHFQGRSKPQTFVACRRCLRFVQGIGGDSHRPCSCVSVLLLCGYVRKMAGLWYRIELKRLCGRCIVHPCGDTDPDRCHRVRRPKREHINVVTGYAELCSPWNEYDIGMHRWPE